MWSARSGILGKRRRWVTSAMIPHLRLVLGAGIGNVLSTSQNLRRGWTTDPGPLSFGPTPPLLANAKTTSDQRITDTPSAKPPCYVIDVA